MTIARARKSQPWPGRLLVALAAIALGVATLACGGPASPANGPGTAGSAAAPDAAPTATRTSNAGQVTIAATWEGPEASTTFTVVLDTHSVDLDGFDLRQLAVLRTDAGREARPTAWDAPAGGHHRSGTLSFPATAADGSPLLGPETRRIELVIRDVAVPERTFTWEL